MQASSGCAIDRFEWVWRIYADEDPRYFGGLWNPAGIGCRPCVTELTERDRRAGPRRQGRGHHVAHRIRTGGSVRVPRRPTVRDYVPRMDAATVSMLVAAVGVIGTWAASCSPNGDPTSGIRTGSVRRNGVNRPDWTTMRSARGLTIVRPPTGCLLVDDSSTTTRRWTGSGRRNRTPVGRTRPRTPCNRSGVPSARLTSTANPVPPPSPAICTTPLRACSTRAARVTMNG